MKHSVFYSGAHKPFLCASALVVGGIAAGVGALGSGIAGAVSNSSAAHSAADAQRDANATNLQIARETNESNTANTAATNATNIQLQQEMNQFNREQWNLNNEYNSPAAQMARARAAGINPNVVASGASSVASSPVQQTTLPQVQTPNLVQGHVDPEVKRTNLQDLSDVVGAIAKGAGLYQENVAKANLATAQAKKTSGEADVASSDASRRAAADAWYQTQTGFKFQFVDDDNEVVRDDNLENVLANPRVTAVRFQFKNKGEYDAYMDTLKGSADRVGYQADKASHLARESRATLDKVISDTQQGDVSILHAIASMPEKQFQEAVARIGQLLATTGKENATKRSIDLQYDIDEWDWQLSKDSDMRNLIKNMFDNSDDMSFKDMIKSFLMVMMPIVIQTASTRLGRK